MLGPLVYPGRLEKNEFCSYLDQIADGNYSRNDKIPGKSRKMAFSGRMRHVHSGFGLGIFH